MQHKETFLLHCALQSRLSYVDKAMKIGFFTQLFLFLFCLRWPKSGNCGFCTALYLFHYFTISGIRWLNSKHVDYRRWG